MSLISLEFAAFVAFAAMLFHASSVRLRPALLCLTSILFCALNSIASSLALLIATIIAFRAARSIDNARDERRRRILLASSVAVLLAHLALIKLMPTFGLQAGGSLLPEILAAFGASYYTLKLVGYLMDVFWR